MPTRIYSRLLCVNLDMQPVLLLSIGFLLTGTFAEAENLLTCNCPQKKYEGIERTVISPNYPNDIKRCQRLKCYYEFRVPEGKWVHWELLDVRTAKTGQVPPYLTMTSQTNKMMIRFNDERLMAFRGRFKAIPPGGEPEVPAKPNISNNNQDESQKPVVNETPPQETPATQHDATPNVGGSTTQYLASGRQTLTNNQQNTAPKPNVKFPWNSSNGRWQSFNGTWVYIVFNSTQIPSNVRNQTVGKWKWDKDGITGWVYNGTWIEYSESGSGNQTNPTVPPDNVCQCGSGAFSGNSGSFASPGYPNGYCNNLVCSYTVTVAPGMGVKLTFEGRTEQCCDNLVFKTHNDKALAGNLGGIKVYSRSNSITFEFRTDDTVTERGFRVRYEAVAKNTIPANLWPESGTPNPTTQPPTANPNCECGGFTHTGETGSIQSNNYPSNYCNNMNCAYTINVPAGKIVKIQLEGEIEECCDELLIGENKMRVSGTLNGKVFYSTGNSIKILFNSDDSVSYRGFKLTFEAVSKNSCLNGGKTVDSTGKCYCPDPFFGNLCQHDGRHCAIN